MKIDRIILPVLAVLALFTSCGQGASDAVLVGVTRPEILSYIETFNAIQDKYKLEVAYTAFTDRGEKRTEPDLVIGEGLATPSLVNRLEPLGKLAMRKWIRSEMFYERSLESCKFENELLLLPLSFSVPVVVFRKGSLKGEVQDDIIVTLEELRKISTTQNEIRQSKFYRVGFSPAWDKSLLYETARMFKSDFSWSEEEILSWDKEAFETACQFLASWHKDLPGTLSMYEDFAASYINKPFYQLVIKGDIFCYLSDTRAFYKIPEEKRKLLEMRWLSRDSKIYVNDDITYIGISRKARQKEGASLFIRWLFLPETQMKLLEINHFKRLDETYGIAGGFSALRDITESYIPQHYPVFSGFIPRKDSFVFPNMLPEKWKDFKDEVLCPWLAERMTVSGTSSKLEDSIGYFKAANKGE